MLKEVAQSSVEGVYAEKKRAEEKLKESGEKFQTLLNFMPDPVVIVDRKGKILAVNDRVEEVSRFKREELLGKNFLKTNIVTAKSKAILIKNLAKRMMRMNIEPYGIEVFTKDGEKIPVEVNARRIEYEGKPADLVVFHDLRRRKKAEEALRDSEKNWSGSFNALEDVMLIISKDYTIEEINDNGLKLLGKTREEVIGKKCYQVIHNVDAPGEFCPCKRTLKTGKAESVDRYDELFDKYFSIKSSPIFNERGEIVRFVDLMRNITERKKAEEKIRNSEEKYRNLFENARDAIITFDLKGTVTSVNKAVEEYGLKKDEIVGKNMLKFVPKRYWPRLLKELAKLARGKPAEGETEIITPKGKRIAEYRANSIRRGKKVIGIQEILRDITERKQMEKKLEEYSQNLEELVEERTRELKESEVKYRGLFDNVNDIVYTLDVNGIMTSGNPAVKKVLGYSPDELNGRHFAEIIPKKYIEQTVKDFKTLLKKGTITAETVLLDKQGREHWVEYNSTTIVKDGKVVGTRGIIRDLTERKKMEERLLKAGRLAAIGEVAAMVGHDLRNPLTSITGAAYYVKTKLGSKMDKKAREMLELIEKDIEYSNTIISDLLEYSKEIQLELAETTPKSIIKNALTLVKVPKNIRILDSTENEPKVKIDVEKLKRVFVNIIKNAIDAMPKGGRLAIKSKETKGNLEIAFTDTGTGMRKEIVKKLWTPLFTTKPKGMGLGLAICKRIVEVHEGKISVESTVGKGTTFTVTIPIKPKLEGGEKIWVNVPESLLSTTTKA